MVAYTEVFILINIVLVDVDSKLYSLFHQEIAKRFDRVRNLPNDPILWHGLRNKVKDYFSTEPKTNIDAKMGYFLHVSPARRVFKFNRYEGETVVGVPANQWHLPAADPLLPGHTLLRPTLSSLKSAVKFPHLENDDDVSGVYGNPNNLGIRYGGKPGRILYSNNRRTLSKNRFLQSFDSSSEIQPKSQYYLVPVSLNSVRGSDTKTLIGNIIENLSSFRDHRHKLYRSPFFQRMRKNLFDHIKVNSNKPELSELIPEDPNTVHRNWWFFNQTETVQAEIFAQINIPRCILVALYHDALPYQNVSLADEGIFILERCLRCGSDSQYDGSDIDDFDQLEASR